MKLHSRFIILLFIFIIMFCVQRPLYASGVPFYQFTQTNVGLVDHVWVRSYDYHWQSGGYYYKVMTYLCPPSGYVYSSGSGYNLTGTYGSNQGTGDCYLEGYNGSEWVYIRFLANQGYTFSTGFSLNSTDRYTQFRIVARTTGAAAFTLSSDSLPVYLEAADQVTVMDAKNAANTAATNAINAYNAANSAATNAMSAYNAANAASNYASQAADWLNPTSSSASAVKDAGGTVLTAARQARDAANQALSAVSNIQTTVNNINNTINTQDTLPPSVELDTVSGARATSSSSIQLVVAASDNKSTSLTYSVNGSPYSTLPADGKIMAPLPSTGPNTITVRVKDEAGNTAVKTIKIWRLS